MRLFALISFYCVIRIPTTDWLIVGHLYWHNGYHEGQRIPTSGFRLPFWHWKKPILGGFCAYSQLQQSMDEGAAKQGHYPIILIKKHIFMTHLFYDYLILQFFIVSLYSIPFSPTFSTLLLAGKAQLFLDVNFFFSN